MTQVNVQYRKLITILKVGSTYISLIRP